MLDRVFDDERATCIGGNGDRRNVVGREVDAEHPTREPLTVRNGHGLDIDITYIAGVLRRFYMSPLSVSSVQPLLQLAIDLNPELTRTKRYL
jgi:hypothetical protein